MEKQTAGSVPHRLKGKGRCKVSHHQARVRQQPLGPMSTLAAPFFHFREAERSRSNRVGEPVLLKAKAGQGAPCLTAELLSPSLTEPRSAGPALQGQIESGFFKSCQTLERRLQRFSEREP